MDMILTPPNITFSVIAYRTIIDNLLDYGYDFHPTLPNLVPALNLMPFSDGDLPYHEALPVDMISRGSFFIYVISPYHLYTAFRAGFRDFFLIFLRIHL